MLALETFLLFRRCYNPKIEPYDYLIYKSNYLFSINEIALRSLKEAYKLRLSYK
jgi:hypothetical protein